MHLFEIQYRQSRVATNNILYNRKINENSDYEYCNATEKNVNVILLCNRAVECWNGIATWQKKRYCIKILGSKKKKYYRRKKEIQTI